MKLRILVTGAKGMLGKDLVPILREKKHDVEATDIEELDITDLDQVYRLAGELKPEVVINCAAYTQVDKAEEEPDKAFAINGRGVRNIALVCRNLGVDICHISTDYVFNGEKKRPYLPEDKPDPINAYGSSKLAGEKFIQELWQRYYIVRTSWLYGKNGKNFVSSILEMAKARDVLRVVDDQIGSPTWTVTLSRALSELIVTKKYGLYHVTDETRGGISWYRFAREIVRLACLDCHVLPAKSTEFPRPAERPKNSVLHLSKIKLLLNEDLPIWKMSLKKFYAEL